MFSGDWEQFKIAVETDLLILADNQVSLAFNEHFHICVPDIYKEQNKETCTPQFETLVDTMTSCSCTSRINSVSAT